MKNLSISVIAFIAIFLLAKTASAGLTEEQKRIQLEKLKALQETEQRILKGEDRFLIDYGGWINFRFDNYNEDDNDTSQVDFLDDTYSLDTRFWMKATLKPPAGVPYKNEHSIYVRFKDIHEQERRFDDDGDYDHNGPHLDYAYLVLDARPYWVEAGRRYFSVGQGIAYGNAHDGVELSGIFEYWSFKAFASHTLPHEDNIDVSAPGWGESDRGFYGAEATYIGIPNHGIYGYALAQRDYSTEDPFDPLRNYSYNSEYFGLGSQGKLMPRMHYWAEIIKEAGKSFVFSPNEKQDIDAWAADVGITYDLEVYSHPNFTIEYAAGSGDSDRYNVTNTEYGNTAGDDENFLYFGYLPSGYAFAPRLSNIHFFKAGVLLKPLERFRVFKNLSFGADYLQYYKYTASGWIYDLDSTEAKTYIGNEIDMRLSWRVLSDLSGVLEYGLFTPKDAFPRYANDKENYFSASVTLTF